MKTKRLIFFILITFLISCKKNTVDNTDLKTFQSSINDIASALPTITQIKFNEALYILKTYGVEGETDVDKLRNLGKLIDDKNATEIFAIADQTAKQNNVDWSSTSSPSLGEMNIFGTDSAKESDPNDVSATALVIFSKPVAIDSVLGSKAILITPRLVDNTGAPITFSGAALQAQLEVYSGGIRLLTAKNIMTNNKFNGFTLRYASLPKDKIVDGKIDYTVVVKTTDKNFKMSKVGVPINPKALHMQQVNVEKKPDETNNEKNHLENQNYSENNANSNGNSNLNNTQNSNQNNNVTQNNNQNNKPTNNTVKPEKPAIKQDPKVTVSKFLGNLSSQNLKAAYESSQNPNWGSYENFSNQTSGFGSVKSLSVKNISTNSSNQNFASVNATYEVTDKNGNKANLQVTFGLKNTNGEWKISSYRINQ